MASVFIWWRTYWRTHPNCIGDLLLPSAAYPQKLFVLYELVVLVTVVHYNSKSRSIQFQRSIIVRTVCRPFPVCVPIAWPDNNLNYKHYYKLTMLSCYIHVDHCVLYILRMYLWSIHHEMIIVILYQRISNTLWQFTN